MRVGLFVTCLVDGLYPRVGLAVVSLLRDLGVELDIPTRQTCCGQMHINSGYQSMAVPMVRNQIRTFQDYDVVVSPSASCVSTIRHQYRQIALDSGEDGLLESVEELAVKTFELTEFLVDRLEVVDVGAYYPHRVTYHPTCHSLRSLGVGDRPHRLLKQVEGLELVRLPEATSCCGFGGTFAVKNSDVSAAMLADKVECIRDSGAEILCTGDTSCLMQIGAGLSRIDAPVKSVHLAEILASRR